jgi:hypothetical protein
MEPLTASGATLTINFASVSEHHPPPTMTTSRETSDAEFALIAPSAAAAAFGRASCVANHMAMIGDTSTCTRHLAGMWHSDEPGMTAAHLQAKCLLTASTFTVADANALCSVTEGPMGKFWGEWSARNT